MIDYSYVLMPQFEYFLNKLWVIRDLERAVARCDDIDRVYVVDDYSEPLRWTEEGPRRCQASPGNFNNIYDVCIVEGNAHLVKSEHCPESWKNGLKSGESPSIPKNLFSLFLRARPSVETVDSPICIPKMPKLSANTQDIERHSVMVPRVDGCFLRIDGEKVTNETPVDMEVPVPEQYKMRNRLVGPNIELVESRYEGKTCYLLVNRERPDNRFIQVRLKWKPPFASLFPCGGGSDLYLHHQLLMPRCVEIAKTDLQSAIRLASFNVARLSSVRASSWATSWYSSRKRQMSEKNLMMELNARFNTAFKTCDEFEASAKFAGLAAVVHENRWFYGWLGFMWSQLLETLRTTRTVKSCKVCGQVLLGGSRRLSVCRSSDNLECFRKRNNESQKRSRHAAAITAVVTQHQGTQ